MAGSSTQAVVLAVVGNGCLTVLKFVAFAFSGSGAMLSEGLHSLADTSNQALLWVGIRRSAAPADATFHYGRGAERFLFALFSAIGIFLVGCGATIYHGIRSLLDPHELHVGWIVVSVLIVSFVVEGFVLWKALQVVQGLRGDKRLFEFLRESSDPTLTAVLLEDAVACVGVLVAACGITLSQLTGSHVPDVIATFVIGAMMGGIAIWLGWTNSSLIIGRAVPSEVHDDAVAFLRGQSTIEHVHEARSRILGADSFRLAAQVDWSGAKLAERVEEWALERLPTLATDDERRAFTREFGERITAELASEVDRIEAELRARHPALRHLDFEGD